MELNAAKTETMVAVCRELFERVLSETPKPLTPEEKLKQPNMDSAQKDALKVGEGLRWKIVSSHWVQLIAQGCSNGEVRKLLERVTADEKELIATNIVNSVVTQSNRLSAIDPKDSNVPRCISVGQQALLWLGSPASENFLGVLANLWPRVLVGAESTKILDDVLQ